MYEPKQVREEIKIQPKNMYTYPIELPIPNLKAFLIIKVNAFHEAIQKLSQVRAT
jgi:hypothetical protein